MRILVVDDSRGSRKVVRRILEKIDQNLVIEEAVDGQDGYQKYFSFQPDLVLSDWLMPKMSGLELLCSLKKEVKDIRFGMITAIQQNIKRETALENGASFFLQKPVVEATLVQKILAEIDRANS